MRKSKKLSGIYAIEFIDGIKIGLSSNIQQRINDYKMPWCKPIKSIYYIECRFPKYVENALINHYKPNIVTKGSTEFITNIPIDDVLRSMEYYKYSKPKYTTIGQYYNFFVEKLE